jgi:hypothetical protein
MLPFQRKKERKLIFHVFGLELRALESAQTTLVFYQEGLLEWLLICIQGVLGSNLGCDTDHPA